MQMMRMPTVWTTNLVARTTSMSALVVEAVPASQTGVASGMNANIRTIGGAIGAAMMSSIVTSGVRAGRLPLKSSYTHGFALLIVVAVAAAAAGVVVPKVRPGIPGGTEQILHAELALVPGGTLASNGEE
jgi:hypothetical protein